MKLLINNKIFIGRYNESRKLEIQLDDENDIIFFKKWEDKYKDSNVKIDYIDDIDFIKITERGILKNCFPILGLNEDSVIIYYDYYTL